MAYIGKQPVVGNFQKCDAISVVNGQAAYTLNVGGAAVSPENANHMLVSLNGVLQAPGDSFTVSGSTLTFASNLATGDVIDFVIILGDVLDLGTPSDNSISTAKLVANSVTAAKFNADVISGQTALAATPADTDELLISDAGVLKRIDYSYIKSTPGLVHIKTQTVSSGVASVDFINGTSDVVFDSTYNAYKLVISDMSIDTDAQKPHIRFRTSSSFVTSGYQFCGETRDTGGNETSFASNSDSDIRTLNDAVGNASDETFSAEIYFHKPTTTDTHKLVHGTIAGMDADGLATGGFFSGTLAGSVDAINGFQIRLGSGNIDRGNFSLYGLSTS
mgnify:CR=1 FL=1